MKASILVGYPEANFFGFWRILLQKSFWGDERQFSGTLTRVAEAT